MSAETLLFSGIDLRSVCLPENLDEFFAPADLRGDLPTSAGVSGAVAVRRPMAGMVRTAEVSVDGDTFTDVRDAVIAVKTILKIGLPQTVTRREITGSGNRDTSQTAIVRGAPERWPGGLSCSLLVAVETVDGAWYGASETIADAAGTVAVKGDTFTDRMTATLSAGAVNPEVANANGYSFRFVGTVPAGDVLVDLAAKRATALGDSSDVSTLVRWPKGAFQLDPGDNTITVSAGTCTLSYYPAYA